MVSAWQFGIKELNKELNQTSLFLTGIIQEDEAWTYSVLYHFWVPLHSLYTAGAKSRHSTQMQGQDLMVQEGNNFSL